MEKQKKRSLLIDEHCEATPSQTLAALQVMLSKLETKGLAFTGPYALVCTSY